MTSPTIFSSVTTEGGLLPPDLLVRIAEADRELDGVDPLAYGLAEGEQVGEAVTRSWNRLAGLWEGFAQVLAGMKESPATEETRRRWTMALLDELGFGRPEYQAHGLSVDGDLYPISHVWGPVPLHLMGANVALDRRTPGVRGAATRSPHGLVQEFLNRSEHDLWGIVCNGRLLRLLRDNASLTRQSYVEFDVEAIFTDASSARHFPDFSLLWRLCHATRFEGDPPAKCLLERWAQDAADRGTRALDQLRGGVERAIEALGSGFLRHPANDRLRAALRSGDLATVELQRQLLRVIYRLLFLLVAEARGLLLNPGVDQITTDRYRRWYSMERLRDLAGQQRGSPHHDDLWAGLAVVVNGLSTMDGRSQLGLPALGSFLWSARATPELDQCRLANDALLEAVRELTWVRDGRVRRHVDYRNLGAEELGSVYEALLELHPVVDVDAASLLLGTAAGNERKSTGSYYTPTSLIVELLDSALDPVLDEAACADDPETAILALKVLDPAAGSGHFLIAAAQRIAERLARVRAGEDEPSPAEVREALRDVIGRCVYGIDVNPMAVELCKVSLWLEATVPGKPLGFLDHRIACGDALLGTTPKLLAGGVPDGAFKPLTGDDRTVVSAQRRRNKQERAQLAGQLTLAEGAASLADAVAHIDALPDDDAAAVQDKAAHWERAQLDEANVCARLAADAWCAAFVAPKRVGEPEITSATVVQLGADPSWVAEDVVERVRELAERYRFLHPHLAFPTVFRSAGSDVAEVNLVTGWAGGFDVVLGNPPWDQIQLEEKQFFAVAAPEIAQAPTGAIRKRMITALLESDPSLHASYATALREVDGQRHFLSSSGRYPLGGRGRVNSYAVFAETMRNAVSPTGRVGVILPTGIATDDTTKFLFGDLVGSGQLASLYDFENRDQIFPAVESRMKFCLLTLAGRERPVQEASFAFFAHATSDLTDPERVFTLSPDDFALLNPNTRTCPVFRTRRDAEITKAIYRRVPVLVKEGPQAENPWGVTFKQGLFNMTSDSGLFRTREELEDLGAELQGNVFAKGDQRWLPLYEAKMIHHFDHRWATYENGAFRDVTLAEKADPCFVAMPRYWVTEHETTARLPGGASWLLGWRDIARSTDERTLISAVVPCAAVGNKFPLMRTEESHRSLLAGSLSSFAADFAARQKLGGASMNFFIYEQLPVVPPLVYDLPCSWDAARRTSDWLSELLVELTCTAWDIISIDDVSGVVCCPFRFDVTRRQGLWAELDACMFHLYGVERDDVDHIMDTFPIVRRRDEAKFGSYRTKDLILEVYDAMAEAKRTGRPYQTILDPPPAHPSLRHPESTRPDWAR